MTRPGDEDRAGGAMAIVLAVFLILLPFGFKYALWWFGFNLLALGVVGLYVGGRKDAQDRG